MGTKPLSLQRADDGFGENIMAKPWYEALYEKFPTYDDEPYTQSTAAEVDFIQQYLGQDKEIKILDVGCGTGRHALEFARRGYPVTGLDLSEEMLAAAEEKAHQQGLNVSFVQGDARSLDDQDDFDAVIILCEGGFSLMETDLMDYHILQGAARALRPGGRLFLTAPSAAHMLANLSPEGGFDPLTLRESFTLEISSSQGEEKSLECSQRYYTFAELQGLLSQLGFQEIQPFAVTGEGYQEVDNFSIDQFELGVMAFKGLGGECQA
jgi:SAM-dependent methyltransferase